MNANIDSVMLSCFSFQFNWYKLCHVCPIDVRANLNIQDMPDLFTETRKLLFKLNNVFQSRDGLKASITSLP